MSRRKVLIFVAACIALTPNWGVVPKFMAIHMQLTRNQSWIHYTYGNYQMILMAAYMIFTALTSRRTMLIDCGIMQTAWIVNRLPSGHLWWLALHNTMALQWRHNERDGVPNHQPRDCLLNRLFRRRSKKTSKLRVTGLCTGNSPMTGEFPAQRTSYAENVSIWWRHHGVKVPC